MTSKRQRVSSSDRNYDAGNKPTKVLSCKRCRARKVKCSYEHPCSGCVRAGVECIQTVNDMRKIRPPLNYVTTLENKVESIMNFFDQFKNLETLEAKQALLDKTDLSKWSDNSEDSSFVHLNHHDDDDRAVYGPTSVYDDTLVKNSRLLKRVEESSIKALNKDPDVLECLKLFFTWQYPDHNMFIFREAFLIDFFNPKSNCLYCSKVLILSICSLGSRMSEDYRIYNKSIEYYREAKSILLSQLNRPSITSMQSYLLLAFYDICNGFNSSGWMLSGNAIRMGYDLGFQLNPEVWFVKSKEDLSPLDVAIRSRIYWGSYTADHFISLLLGRPSLLKVSDASIAETNDLPDLEWIDEFTYSGLLKRLNKEHRKDVSYISNPLNNIIKLINISDNMLNDIFTKSDVDHHDEVDLSSRLAKLFEYNSQIRNWKDCLPEDLQWDRNTLKQSADNPTLTCIRYYYYILLLCLNRPFLGILKNNHKGSHSLSPMAICSEGIEDLYEAIKKFNHVHGLRRVSIFMVYCSILSISIILLTNTSKELLNQMNEKLQFFMNVLRGCSKTWKLAEKSYKLIKIKLQARKDELDELESMQDTNPTTSQTNSKTSTLSSITTSNHHHNHQNNHNHHSHHQNHKNHLDNNRKPDSRTLAPISDIMNPSINNQAGTISASSSQSNHTSQQSPWENSSQHYSSNATSLGFQSQNIIETNTEILFGEDLDFLGGPPVLMTSDLFNEDWEALFPDYVLNAKH
jgi:hypothetical protein